MFLSAFFSSAETAFQKLNKYRFVVLSKNGSRTARLVLWLHDRFDGLLVAILIGNNIVNTILSVLFTSIFLNSIPSLEPGVNSLIASIILTIIVYLLGETLPKQIAGKIPNRISSLVVYPLVVVYFILFPFSFLLSSIGKAWRIILKRKERPSLTEEDFTSVIEKNEGAGLLEENESDLIQASFDFSDTSVKEVLTPKEKMFEIDLKGLSPQGLADKICDTKFSRIPLYVGDPSKIVGILIVKKYLAAYLTNPSIDIRDYMEKPYVVSPSVMVDDLIDGFRAKKTQVALVMRKKTLIGMVTMEDVLEELVGPIGEKITLPRGVRK